MLRKPGYGTQERNGTMPRKMKSGGTSGGTKRWTIAMDHSRSTSREPYRCRVSGFKSAFFGITPLAACQQAGLAITSQIEHRTATTSTATATAQKGRKATVRTRRPAGRQLAETL